MRANRLLWLLLLLSSGTRLLAGQSAVAAWLRSWRPVALAQTTAKDLAGGLTISPSSLSFGNEQLNSPTAPQFITITNPGKSSFMIKEIASSTPDFTLVHNCALSPDPMPARSSCGIYVRFAPGAAGLRSGNIRITIDGDRPVQPLVIPLQGNGVQSAVTLSQTYLIFRTLLVGMTSMPQYVRLTNHSSTAPAKILSIAVSPDFSLTTTTDQCVTGLTLAPLAACTLAVVWTPTDSGSRDGQVTIAESDAGPPQIIDLHAPATAIRLSSGTLRWSPTAVGVAGDSQSMEVKNEGRTSIEIGSVEASGDFYQQNNCGKELTQHQSCSVTVWFQPAAAGERVGTLLIHDSDVTGMQQVFLTGVGSLLDLSPVKVDFGTQAVESTSAPQVVAIANRGSANVSITAINVSGDFVVPGKTCGDTIVPGKSCRVSISFSPTVTGTRTGTLSIETATGSITRKVALSGTGQ